MKQSTPYCKSLRPWLSANLGPRCLEPLTGTDARALSAAVHIAELYSYHREPGVLEAFGHIVRCMQPSTQELAFHAIAHVMDWSDRLVVWKAAGLENINTRLCNFEPGGSLRVGEPAKAV